MKGKKIDLGMPSFSDMMKMPSGGMMKMSNGAGMMKMSNGGGMTKMPKGLDIGMPSFNSMMKGSGLGLSNSSFKLDLGMTKGKKPEPLISVSGIKQDVEKFRQTKQAAQQNIQQARQAAQQAKQAFQQAKPKAQNFLDIFRGKRRDADKFVFRVKPEPASVFSGREYEFLTEQDGVRRRHRFSDPSLAEAMRRKAEGQGFTVVTDVREVSI